MASLLPIILILVVLSVLFFSTFLGFTRKITLLAIISLLAGLLFGFLGIVASFTGIIWSFVILSFICLSLSGILFYLKDVKLRKLCKKAETGNAYAQYDLGMYYIFNLPHFSFWKNMEKALYWLTLSAQQGNKDAIEKLIEGYSDKATYFKFGINPEKEQYWRSKLR